jgi:hypothetical protein
MDPRGAELTVVKFCRHASGKSPDPSELAGPTFRFPAFALIRTGRGEAAPIGLARGQGRCLAHPTLKAIGGRHGRTGPDALTFGQMPMLRGLIGRRGYDAAR